MISRRMFLGGSFATLPALTYRRAFSADAPPSDTVRVGVIGTGRQGLFNIGALQKQKRVRVTAVADVDTKHLADGAKAAGGEPGAFADYRKLLDAKDLDAVLIATPDHWHALVCIHACQAGKDVYCEKPLSLTIQEGRRMVEAARMHKRIVQTGSQQRSSGEFQQAVDLVRGGAVGKVHTVKVGLPKVNFSGDAVNDSDPPANLDYDRWLGPAPLKPYNEKHVHYLFRFYWDYSGGQQTNFGAHHLDIAQWGLNRDDSGPVSAVAEARYDDKKRYEVPSWSAITYQYADGVTMLCGQDHPAGTEFIGDKGSILVVRGKLTAKPGDLTKHEIGDHVEKSTSHHGNWLACIKSRKTPVADVEIGHRSATVCHLGNLAVRLGRKVEWNPETESVLNDSEAQAMTDKAYRAGYGI